MSAYLQGVQFCLPERLLTNDDLVGLNPDWNADAIFAKTGIRSRHVAAANETAGDLAAAAAESLLAELAFPREKVDALLFCTQSPDYFLPSTACILQDRLKLPTTCAAFDFSLGCSGFTYALWLARSLLLSESAKNVLLLVGDTYSKYCDPHDLTTVTIFGDGGAAALVTRDADGALAEVGPSVVGTDGRGAQNLIVRTGCARQPFPVAAQRTAEEGTLAPDRSIAMVGPEIFSFTLNAVRGAVDALLTRMHLTRTDVDCFLFHQANRFMLEHLRRVMNIPATKMPIDMEDVGNTVSATIPILMRRQLDAGRLPAGSHYVLAGFGVGYSWAMTYLRWLRNPA